MKSSTIQTEISSISVIKRIILPTFFEFIILFAVPITDIVFLRIVNKDLINVFAIFSILAGIAILHTQNFSNLTAAELHTKSQISIQNNYLYVLLFNICIAVFYIFIYMFLSEKILQYGGIYNINPSNIAYFNLMVLSLLFRCSRKLPIAFDIVSKNAKHNVYFSIATFLCNIVFNSIVFYIYKTYKFEVYFFSIGIGLSTILSHLLITVAHIFSQRKWISFKYIQSTDLLLLFKKLYVSSISSIESMSYSLAFYIFIGILAYITPEMYLYRNIIAPFFLLSTAVSIAWALNINRVSFLIQRHKSHDNTIQLQSLLYTSMKNSLISCLLVGIISSVISIFSIGRMHIHISLFIILMLLVLELIRSMNLNILSLLRSLHFVKYSVCVGVLSNVILVIISIIIRNRLSENALIGGVILMCMLIVEEGIRTLLNYLLVILKLRNIK